MTADRKKNRRFCMHPRAQSRSVACLFLILMLLAGGCSLSGADEFPTLETHASPVPGQSESVDQTDPSENAQTDPVSLSLAVPYGNDVADLLRLLFLARKSGLQPLGDGHSIGLYVQAEDLLQYDGPLQLSIQTVSASSGATDEQVKSWQASGLLPDVIYVREAAHAPGLDQLLDVSKWVFADELLTARHLYPESMNSMRQGQSLYGIPFLASTPLVFFNKQLLMQYQSAVPVLNQTWGEWLQLLASLQARVSLAGLGATPADLAVFAGLPLELETHLKQTVFLVENPVDFLPFLPSSLSQEAGWAMWQGLSFNFADDSFKTAADWLRSQVLAGYSPWHLDFEQRSLALDVSHARADNRVIFWLGDSTDLSAWHQQSSLSIGEFFVPAGSPYLTSLGDGASDDQAANPSLLLNRLPIEVRSLVVSRTTRHPALAAELAVFLAQDIDSLLVQSRYQLYEGLFPLVQDQQAWDAMVDRQPYGHILLTIKDRLPYAYCSGRQMISSWDVTMNQIFDQLAARYLSMADPSGLSPLMNDISRTARRIMVEE